MKVGDYVIVDNALDAGYGVNDQMKSKVGCVVRIKRICTNAIYIYEDCYTWTKSQLKVVPKKLKTLVKNKIEFDKECKTTERELNIGDTFYYYTLVNNKISKIEGTYIGGNNFIEHLSQNVQPLYEITVCKTGINKNLLINKITQFNFQTFDKDKEKLNSYEKATCLASVGSYIRHNTKYLRLTGIKNRSSNKYILWYYKNAIKNGMLPKETTIDMFKKGELFIDIDNVKNSLTLYLYFCVYRQTFACSNFMKLVYEEMQKYDVDFILAFIFVTLQHLDLNKGYYLVFNIHTQFDKKICLQNVLVFYTFIKNFLDIELSNNGIKSNFNFYSQGFVSKLTEGKKEYLTIDELRQHLGISSKKLVTR